MRFCLPVFLAALFEKKWVNQPVNPVLLADNPALWLILTISRGRNMSSCRRTTRHTLSPCRVLRSIHTNSSWPTPVISTPLTYTHTHTHTPNQNTTILSINKFFSSSSLDLTDPPYFPFNASQCLLPNRMHNAGQSAALYLKYAVSRLKASILDSGSTRQNVFDEDRTRAVDWRISGYYSKTKTFRT